MAKQMFESIIIMIIGCLISITMIRFVGEALDKMVLIFQRTGFTDVAEVWQTSPSLMINLFYIAAMLPAVVSIILAVLRSQMKTEVEVGAGFGAEEFEFQELR